MPCRLFLHRILVVADVHSRSNPSFAKLLGVDDRIHQRSHSMVIQRVRLEQVNNVESISTPSDRIRCSKVEPLSIPSCVVVWLED